MPGRERGGQSFCCPQFGQAGTPGFGKLYTYFDSSNMTPEPDFTTPNPKPTHDLVLLEWTVKNPAGATYDGDAPRELMRWRQPFANHNGGAIAFNSTARAGSTDFGLPYIGVGGRQRRRPDEPFTEPRVSIGTICRIDYARQNGRAASTGSSHEPVPQDGRGTAGNFGVGRNAQRSRGGIEDAAMSAGIGQNVVEEVSPGPSAIRVEHREGSFVVSAGHDEARVAIEDDVSSVEWGQRPGHVPTAAAS